MKPREKKSVGDDGEGDGGSDDGCACYDNDGDRGSDCK